MMKKFPKNHARVKWGETEGEGLIAQPELLGVGGGQTLVRNSFLSSLCDNPNGFHRKILSSAPIGGRKFLIDPTTTDQFAIVERTNPSTDQPTDQLTLT